MEMREIKSIREIKKRHLVEKQGIKKKIKKNYIFMFSVGVVYTIERYKNILL